MSTPDVAEPARRSAKRLFAATVLVLEAFVMFFAALVAYGLRAADPAVIWVVGGGVALAALLAAGLLRSAAGEILGWAVQVWLLATGVVVPAMFGVGAIFAALWVVALRLGARIDRERADRLAAS